MQSNLTYQSTEPQGDDIICGKVNLNKGFRVSRYLYCGIYYANIYYRVYFLPICILSGIVGNALTIRIFCRRKDWVTTWRVYYLTMALSDLAYIISFGIPEWTGEGLQILTGSKFDIIPENLSTFTCRLLRFIWHLSWFISIWALLCYSLEKLAVLFYYYTQDSERTVAHSKKICQLIFLSGTLLFSPILLSRIYVLNENLPVASRYCYLNTESSSIVLLAWFGLITLILTILVPPILLAIANGTIFFRLLHLRTLQNEILIPKPECIISQSEIKAAKDLLIVSIVTMVFTFPTSTWAYIYCEEGIIH